jgi:hypothetical protein
MKNRVLIATAVLLSTTSYANSLKPHWTISCSRSGGSETLEIGLYRTGHPMGGLFSYSGLVAHDHLVFLADFIKVAPPVLNGQAGGLDQTEYEIELMDAHLNTSADLPAKMRTSSNLPLGGKVRAEVSLICRGHQ